MTIKPGYIRVSEILGQWNRFANIKEEVLKRKAAIGTAIHEAIAASYEDIYLPVFQGKEYLQSFWKWLQASKAEICFGGQRYYCDILKITGEVDAVVKFPNESVPVLIDWKTSATKDELYWKLQGQFYIYLCAQNGVTLSERFLFIQLDKDGGMPKVHEFNTSRSLMNVCMSAYVCYKYMNRVD